MELEQWREVSEPISDNFWIPDLPWQLGLSGLIRTGALLSAPLSAAGLSAIPAISRFLFAVIIFQVIVWLYMLRKF